MGAVESIDTAVGRGKWDFVNTVLKSGCITRRKFLEDLRKYQLLQKTLMHVLSSRVPHDD
jgi:hypothetical protein